MAIRVRPLDLDTEEEELLALLQRNLADLPHARRFKWLYRENPLGPAWTWLAWDTDTKQTIGAASVFRRAVWLQGRVQLCGQVGDFAIDVTHRSLGPALLLQRATFAPVDAGQLTFCYDCPPHERGMSTFRRLGMAPNATMARHARLLGTERQLVRRFGAVGTVLAPIADAVLGRLQARRTRAPGFEITDHRQRFEEEFTLLDRRLTEGAGVRGRRAAADLNWRYLDDPLTDYLILVARRHGELVGFTVLTVSGRDGVVVDLFGDLSSDEAADLLDTAARRLRATGVEVLHAVISNPSRLAEPLARCGFRLRSTGPLVVAYTRSTWSTETSRAKLTWNLNYSDVMA
jgi:hypothetical protein